MSKHIEARHWYSDSPFIEEKRQRTTIVAVINEGVSWAAYMGAVGPENLLTEEQAAEHVSHRGGKLPEAVAKAFFRGIDEPYRS